MKPILFMVILLSYFGKADLMAQRGSNNKNISKEIFNLLQLKQKYDEQISRIHITTSVEDRKTIATAQLINSDYSKSVKTIQNNPKKYLTYLNKAINEQAEILSREYVDWQPKLIYESRAVDYYYISKLDYLKAIRYSLFDQKSDSLLPLGKIPGIKPRYPEGSFSVVRPKKS
jgi:hypothetical protein